MPVVVLVGPAATRPLDVARGVAARRALTAVIDVRELHRSMVDVVGADPDAQVTLAAEAACAIGGRLDMFDLGVVLVDTFRPGAMRTYREGLVFVSSVTLIALTADPLLLATRGMARTPFRPSGLGAVRDWRGKLAELRGVHPNPEEFDLVIDCSAVAPVTVADTIERALHA